MATWVQKQQEETYLKELDQIVLKRLKNNEEETEKAFESSPSRPYSKNLSILSLEINEELDRLERMLQEREPAS